MRSVLNGRRKVPTEITPAAPVTGIRPRQLDVEPSGQTRPVDHARSDKTAQHRGQLRQLLTPERECSQRGAGADACSYSTRNRAGGLLGLCWWSVPETGRSRLSVPRVADAARRSQTWAEFAVPARADEMIDIHQSHLRMALHGEPINEQLPQHQAHQPYGHIGSCSSIDVEPLVRDPVRGDEHARSCELRVGAVTNDLELGVARPERSCGRGIGRRRSSRQKRSRHAEDGSIVGPRSTRFDGHHVEPWRGSLLRTRDDLDVLRLCADDGRRREDDQHDSHVITCMYVARSTGRRHCPHVSARAATHTSAKENSEDSNRSVRGCERDESGGPRDKGMNKI